jgi:hypothetical protein
MITGFTLDYGKSMILKIIDQIGILKMAIYGLS